MVAAQEQQILEQAAQQLAAAEIADLDKIKSEFLGKRGHIGRMLQQIGQLPPEQRKEAGIKTNAVRSKFEQMLSARREELKRQRFASQEHEAVDVTLAGRGPRAGALHPISQVTERVAQIFASMGFAVADGPEIEDDFHNFEALNHPEDHPARSMHDTFYLQDGRLLRTHTSPVQIRYLKSNSRPVRIIAPGRCYRVDNDATHSPMFHQVEGLWVDDQVRFSDLKGILLAFFSEFFEDASLQVRFRPSYFPFTEPSAECDIKLRGKWLEVAGCGMVHPNVLAAGGHDPQLCQGWAFGTGLDRLAMLRYGFGDLRALFENDLRFLAQFA